MNRHFLYSILLSCLLLLLPLTSEISYSQALEAINENDVLAVLNAVDKAAKRSNIPGIIAPLARDVKIKMRVSIPGSDKEQLTTLNKEQYTFVLKQAFRKRLRYQYERKNTRIKIYNDNKTAMVTCDIYEILTLREGTLRTVSSEVAILNLQNGKILVTSIEGRTRFY